MHEPDAGLLPLAEALADGAEIDWDHAESSAVGDQEQRVVRQLRLLAGMGAAARAAAQSWGPLEIRGEVGSGTFGAVYRAWDPRLQREVALKLLHPLRAERQLASTVIKEARLLAQIRHPNVVVVHGADVFDDRVGIWMEFVTGRTLKEMVSEHGPFGADEASLIGRHLCRALAAVHQRGFVHRDLKAQNVMREAGGRTVLMDFGASEAASRVDMPLAGSPAYLAPEVLEGQPATIKSDLYSLGVLLYHLVSGQFPVTGESLQAIREQHRVGKRQRLMDLRPDLAPAFVHAVDRATAANPAERPDSAGEMEAILDGTLSSGSLPRPEPIRPAPALTAPVGVALAAVAAVAIAVGAFVLSDRDGSTLSTSSATATARDSVVIMPFQDTLTGEGRYLGDGFRQNLVDRLSAIPHLRVIAGAQVERLATAESDPGKIALELGASAAVHGTFEQQQDRVRLNVRLIEAGSGEVLWRQTFERALTGIVQMQVDLSTQVAVALRGPLSETESHALRRRGASDAQAARLYMEGRYAASLRTENGLQRSLQSYQEAIRRDANYALAFTGLADSYVSLASYGHLPSDEAYARAAEAAAKAIELDPTLAEAHLSLAFVQRAQFHWREAEDSFRRAIELKPNLAQAHHWYSIYLMQVGRFPEAITEIKTALSLDPKSIGANLQFASALLMARRYEDAIGQWRHAIEIDPTFVNAYRGIAIAYALLGKFDEALAAAAEAKRASPPGADDRALNADLGYVFAIAGKRDDARRIARDMERRYHATGERLAGSIAAIYTGLGDTKIALDWLDRATGGQATGGRATIDPDGGFLKVEPRWDPLRSSPRFQDMLVRLGFD